MPPDSWGLVVPVKRLARAKTRLQSYGDVWRQDLALAFALDVVAAGIACADVAEVLVVTDDERAADAVGRLGARVVADSPDAGLNPALEHGAALLRGDGAGGVATVSADLPALRPEELTAALASVPRDRRAFVTDHAGTGTTLLAAPAGLALAAGYGPSSRSAHLGSGAVELTAGPGLRRDVDTPEDLREAVVLGVGPATSAVLAALRLA